MNRETISKKADRLKANFRAILLSGTHAVVIGDHDTYEVVRVGSKWTCNCLWGRLKSHWADCSHVVSVRRALQDPNSQAPVARLADMLKLASSRQQAA